VLYDENGETLKAITKSYDVNNEAL
jgi:hypothetical protein